MVTDGKITAPVGLASTANFFGVASDVMTVCQASAINKWAKYKPIALSSMGKTDTPASLTEAQRKAADYGLTYKYAHAASKSELPDKIDEVCGDNGSWTYTKPVSGTDYARLDDFANPNDWTGKAGYYHNSQAPCESTELTTTKYDATSPKDIYVTFVDGMTAASLGQLCLNEFGIYDSVLGRSYLCLALKSGSEWYYIFSRDTLANMVTWTDSTPQASVPFITTSSLFPPFQDISEGGKKVFPVRLFLIDLYDAFSGSVPSTYPGGCIAQSSLAATHYNIYSLPLKDMSETVASFEVYKPASATSLVYGYDVAVGSSTTVVTITVTNDTTSQATLKELFVYIMADFTFNYGQADEDVHTAADEWVSSGRKETGGITADGLWGTGVYAAYGAAAITSGVIAAKATKTFTIEFQATSDAFGYTYENPVIFGCANDTKSGRRNF